MSEMENDKDTKCSSDQETCGCTVMPGHERLSDELLDALCNADEHGPMIDTLIERHLNPDADRDAVDLAFEMCAEDGGTAEVAQEAKERYMGHRNAVIEERGPQKSHKATAGIRAEIMRRYEEELEQIRRAGGVA